MKREGRPDVPFWLSLNWEAIGEWTLLGIATCLMLTMLVQSFGWNAASALMPRIAASAGLFFVGVRVVAILRGNARKKGGRIMDIGFTATDDAKTTIKRFTQSAGSLLILVFGILLLGWHVALPLWMLAYFLLFSGQRWYWGVLAAIAFEAAIILIYDRTFSTIWNEPWIVHLWEPLSNVFR